MLTQVRRLWPPAGAEVIAPAAGGPLRNPADLPGAGRTILYGQSPRCNGCR
jgi:hypothetical protein